jgi:hypothetical protein
MKDEPLFGSLVDALAGVAAEAEYVSDDLLMIHRAVFVGGPILATYATKSSGQFQSWAVDTLGAEPFWQVVTQIEKPPFKTYQIDVLGR